jgi:hypothetical protein
MSLSLLLIMIVALLPLMSCFGCLFLLQSINKSSKKYQALIIKLKRQGTYEEWVYQHKALVFLERIYLYFRISVVLLVVIGFMIEFVSMPKIFITSLEILGYAY